MIKHLKTKRYTDINLYNIDFHTLNTIFKNTLKFCVSSY